eukprot:TRINITY_DN65761_c6_g1_i1.p1 TRINITY_DN65761_c6_g1~~TRINITY_DN65761_c6_g1_i1.p1  ORF type:complete len:189 (+),score=88.56 TRINITY_DN65761_c6_g1_i1:44-568(+)
MMMKTGFVVALVALCMVVPAVNANKRGPGLVSQMIQRPMTPQEEKAAAAGHNTKVGIQDKLYVANVAPKTNIGAVEKMFDKLNCGHIKEAVVMPDHKCLVAHFETPEAAANAMATLSGKSLDGRQLKFARQPEVCAQPEQAKADAKFEAKAHQREEDERKANEKAYNERQKKHK